MSELREDLFRLIFLQDSNTRVVLAGTALLGLAAGVIGALALLRKRALVGDALSHAALPGLCLAFLLIGHKDFFGLLVGASFSGVVGILLILGITKWTRVDEDSAIGIVLSGLFGVGICLSRIIQNQPNGMQAGLEGFIYGKAASMLGGDALLIGVACLVVLLTVGLLFKELAIVCFDPEFARTTGWPVGFLDIVLMTCVVVVTMVGLQSVGVVLIISLLITPAAAARFWTERLERMVYLSALFGGLSAVSGTVISALFENLPTGPLIVLCSAVIFFISGVFAPARGLLAQLRRAREVQNKIRRQNLLRSICEYLESVADLPLDEGVLGRVFDSEGLLTGRFSPKELARELRAAERAKLIECRKEIGKPEWLLTDKGRSAAIEVLRNHRMWELYLITFADIAATHVDASADYIEHILPRDTVVKLESLLREKYPDLDTMIARSPHKVSFRAALAEGGS